MAYKGACQGRGGDSRTQLTQIGYAWNFLRKGGVDGKKSLFRVISGERIRGKKRKLIEGKGELTQLGN